MAAAILHDCGKTREFSYGAEIGITDEGRLLGHLAIGAQMIAARPARSPKSAGWHCSTACSRTTGPTRARAAFATAGGRVRVARGARPLPAERARRLGQGRARARDLAVAGARLSPRRTSCAAITSARRRKELERALRNRVRDRHAARHPERGEGAEDEAVTHADVPVSVWRQAPSMATKTIASRESPPP